MTRNKKNNKNFTATLARFVSVAVILFFVASCGNKTNKTTKLNSIEDTLAYTMGSMQEVSYKLYMVSCGIDTIYDDSFFKGVKKGYFDKDHYITYYDGISICMQIMGYFSDKDSLLRNANFGEGILDGAISGHKKTSFRQPSDSVIYNMGLNNSDMLKTYISEFKYKGDTLKQFVEGFTEAYSSVEDAEKSAYTNGIVFGGSRLRKALRAFNFQLYGSDSTKTVSSDLFFAGLEQCDDPKAIIPHSAVREVFDKADLKIKESLYADNKAKGEEFLKKNAENPGVVTLEDGLQYKIIKKGSGKLPADNANVEVNYRGKTIDGTVFDDSHETGKPVTMNVRSVIPGFSKALQMMPEGSSWEVYIPYELAYGTTQSKMFQPFSVIIFEIELIKILK